MSGVTAAVEEGVTWAVAYEIETDSAWATRSAAITGWSDKGVRETELTSDGFGRWTIDGRAAPALDGCLDVDLESSACTNLLPLRRAGEAVVGPQSVPTAYVRAVNLRVERLEQTYTCQESVDGAHAQYDYTAPALEFACRLEYDRNGLVVNYPGLAARVR